MANQVLVGSQSASDGTFLYPRGSQTGATVVTALHGDHYEQTYRGNVFSINTQGTGVTTTAALATTWTGLGISNPAGSGVNLVLIRFTCSQFAVGAAAAIGILGGVGVLSATLTPQNRLIGAAGVSKARGSATDTISTPLLIGTYGQVGSLATTGYGMSAGVQIELNGGIIVPPGSFIGSYTSVVTTSALNFGYVWEEVPI